jgi:hypothetical protein
MESLSSLAGQVRTADIVDAMGDCTVIGAICSTW